MSPSSDGSNNTWQSVREHVRRNLHVWGPVASFLVGLLFFGVVLGFRGFGPAALELADAARDLAEAGPENIGPEFVESPHPFLELVGAWLHRLADGAFLANLRPLSVVAAAASLPAIWGIGAKLGDWRHGAASVVVFASLPVVAGAGTTVAGGALFLLLWSWFLRWCLVEYQPLYLAPILWTCGAALLMTWPPFLLWGVLWMYLELRESAVEARDKEALSGELSTGAIPVAISFAPIAIFCVATLLHPALRAAPVEGWRQFFDFALTWEGPAFRYDDWVYTESRPPLWTGYLLLSWVVPPATLLAAAMGWIAQWYEDWRATRSGRLAQRMLLWGLPIVGFLPWLHRGPAWGHLSFVLVAAPLLAVAAGATIVRALRTAASLLREHVDTGAGRTAPGIAAAALVAAFCSVPLRAHPVEGSYYSGLFGGFEAAVRRGLSVSRDRVYPLAALRRAGERVGSKTLNVVGNDRLVDAYRRLDLLPGVKPAPSPFFADRRIRRIGSFQPGSGGVDTNPHALVDLSRGATPLLSIDGVPIYWLETSMSLK